MDRDNLTGMHQSQKIRIFAVVGLMVCLCIGAVGAYGLIKHRRTAPRLYLKTVTISRQSDEVGEDVATTVQDMLYDRYGRRPAVREDLQEDRRGVFYLCGPELAGERGVNLSGIEENGYVISHENGCIYLYATDPKGFICGADRLLSLAEDDSLYPSEKKVVSRSGHDCPAGLTVGDREIAEYSILVTANDRAARQSAHLLQHYIAGVSGEYLPISESGENGTPGIVLSVDHTLTEGEGVITITDGNIVICGSGWEEVSDQVYLFANRYLGWAFAGEEREHILSHRGVLHMTDNTYSPEGEAWMEEREPIICLWKTNVPRGEYYSPDTSLKSELLSYSDDQLYEYVKMMNYFGYTGIQVTDMCSAWAAYGGYEYVQERLRFMADAAHSLDMKFTLWVWGAEFNGYGWVDNNVSYYAPEQYTYAYENPQALDTFDKYYSIYEQLADCSDRVIMHFNDPGHLSAQEDICFFAAMFRDKVKSVNPKIDFGVSCYTDQIDRDMLVGQLGTDITIYGTTPHTAEDDLSAFRTRNAILGVRQGVWSWNLAEMEIDQLAEMNVNAKIIQSAYRMSAQWDEGTKPVYWSEMDSYHMVNLFSLYCSGRLLCDPDRDTDELLHEIARDVAGEEYAGTLYEILTIVQDARSGDRWETFRWENEQFIMKSDAYDPQDILDRCNTYLPSLDEMIAADLNDSRIPLAISEKELLQLIRPHVEQIRQFAGFRLALEEAEELLAQGADRALLQEKVDGLYEPIPEYNCVIGVWGQAEARAQCDMLEEFCGRAGLDMPEDPLFAYHRKQRIYQEFCAFQKGKADKVTFDKATGFQWGVGFGADDTLKLVNELIGEGLLSETEEGRVYLTDWENYRYHF